MDYRAIQMTTKNGFVSLFWSDLKKARKTNPKTTHEQIYNQLEFEYFNVFKQRRYSSFKSFLSVRDRK